MNLSRFCILKPPLHCLAQTGPVKSQRSQPHTGQPPSVRSPEGTSRRSDLVKISRFCAKPPGAWQQRAAARSAEQCACVNGHGQLRAALLLCHFTSASIWLLTCLLLCLLPNEREGGFSAPTIPTRMALPEFAADSKAGQVEDTTEPTNIRVSLVHLGHRPMAEDIQRKPSPGAPGTQTSALPWLKEPHADPQGPAMTWWVLTKFWGITEHGKPRLCPHPMLHHPHLGAQLASWGVSSSPG